MLQLILILFCEARDRAEIQTSRFHDMRHIFAGRLAMAGHNEGISAAFLRHSSTALVKRYAHLSALHLHAAVEIVFAFPLVQTHQDESIPNGTVTETGTVGSVEEGNGVEVAEKFGAPDTN